jgi:hypothetical protein
MVFAMDVSREQVESFRRDGFLILPRIWTEAQVSLMKEAIDRVSSGRYSDDRRPPALRKPVAPLGTSQSVHWYLNARILDRDIWTLATDARLGGIAARLLETDSVSIVEDQLLDKPPTGLPVNSHQDYAYWPFSTSTEMITCWIALEDMRPELGPVAVVRGSHRWGQGQKPQDLIEGSASNWLAAAEASRPRDREIEIVSAQVPAGGGVFFHALTFHGSPGNSSAVVRRACSLHFASSACRVHLAATARVNHPFFFANLKNGGPLVNRYMPRVYPTYAESA